MGARVRVNFGPDFRYPPLSTAFRPMEAAAAEQIAALALREMVDKVASGYLHRFHSMLASVLVTFIAIK